MYPNDKTTKQVLASIKTEILNLKLDTKNVFKRLYSAFENLMK